MNRKRNDDECSDHDDKRLSPTTKRIKSPLPAVDQLQLNEKKDESMSLNSKQSTHTQDENTLEQNGSIQSDITSKLSPQSSSEVCHNRKRRSRTSQELSGFTTTATDSSVPCVTTSVSSQSRKKSDLSCVVCCGLAHGYNFDAISCESCKAFFRRNALFNMERLKCRRDGSCDISLDTRRRCKSCRLKKCFAVGMRKEWILTDEEKMNKKRRIEENKRLRMANTNDSILSKETVNCNGKLDRNLQNGSLHTNNISSLHSTLLSQNNDVISSVVTAFNDGFQLDSGSYGWSYPLARKITALCQILNTKNTTALRFISFYKRLAEFDALNDIDKVNLIKNNLPHIFMFHGSLGYDPINDIYREGNPPNETLLYGADIREKHGDDIHIRCTLIMRSLHSIVQMDERIIQLALIIILFSKGLSGAINFSEPLLNNGQQVFRAQNFYVEQLWLFMEKFYGPSRTALTFATLISKCLLIQELLRDIQHDIHERIDSFQVPPIIQTLVHLAS